eukprot:845257-Rhodomonas_salina.2
MCRPLGGQTPQQIACGTDVSVGNRRTNVEGDDGEMPELLHNHQHLSESDGLSGSLRRFAESGGSATSVCNGRLGSSNT